MKFLVASCVFMSAVAAAADPIIIAHRGASGYLPEHTLEAYAMAYAMGAHYVEPDLVRTKDGAFICLHDIHLEGTTNVEEVFPDRAREDGRWYPIDFTLAEIKTLQVHERIESRFPEGKSDFEVPTFQEMIELIQGLNASTGRDVGIYPELKGPSFHREEGLPMEEDFLAIIRKYGYKGPQAKIFVQCFEHEPLIRLRELGSMVPQVFLLGGGASKWFDEEGIAEAKKFANGFGPSKTLIERDPECVARIHAAGMVIHPYTMRADDVGRGYIDMSDELKTFFEKYKVDGVFTDHPDVAIQFLKN